MVVRKSRFPNIIVFLELKLQ